MKKQYTSMNDKIVLVSGGTSGVGKAAAIGIARLGAKIVIISRTKERGIKALKEIARTTGNNQGEYILGDLSLYRNVKKIADVCQERYPRIDVLVNAAGAIITKSARTSEGIDQSLAINYFSHFWLATELVNLLEKSENGRIITVTGQPIFVKYSPIIIPTEDMSKKEMKKLASLGTLAMKILFTKALSKRLANTNVIANTFHPGFVQSELGRDLPFLLKLIGNSLNFIGVRELEIGKFLASAASIAKVTDSFFDNKGKRIDLPSKKYNDDYAERIWVYSMNVTEKI
ncbi:SDR family NAD(P)-dependent oxidoreductase (plasmid) [Arthrobacter citreus]|nr:SDR family NAD(P)-dependent oxidoreductase [Arthrobacter citreus]